MATAYSSEVAVGTYNRIRIKCDYSGTSASLTVQFRRTSARTDSWYDSTATLTFNGQDKSSPYSYTGTVSTSWVDLVTVSGYTISASGGTYNWSFNNHGSAVLGCSGTITLQAQGTAPTGLRGENLALLSEGFTADVVIDDWGDGGTATTRYKYLAVYQYDESSLTLPRRYTLSYGNELSSTITVDNSSTSQESSGTRLDLIGNTRYTLAVYASNGAVDTGTIRWMDAVTLAYKPEVHLYDVTKTTATIHIHLKADGGFYEKTVYYSLDNGTNWIPFRTNLSGDETTLTLVLNHLVPGTQYTIKIGVETPAGENIANDITFYTSAQTPTLYTSNSLSRAEEVLPFYGSNGSTAQNIVKMYGGSGGEAVLVFDNSVKRTGRPSLPPTNYGRVYYKETSSSSEIKSVELQSVAEFESLCSTNASTYTWTATVGEAPVTLSSRGDNCIVGVEIGTEITSVPNYFLLGCSYYNGDLIVPDNVTSLGNYFAARCGNSSNKLTVVDLGKNVATLGTYCLVYSYFETNASNVYLPQAVTSIPNYFMYYSYQFNNSIKIPSKVTSIGTYFLSFATTFNSKIMFNSVLTTIGGYFLRAATSYNQDITLPSTLTSIGTNFLYQCNDMVSTVNVGSLAATVIVSSNNSLSTGSSSAAMYTTGVKIAGQTRADWITRLPDRTSAPYRKLINAGY